MGMIKNYCGSLYGSYRQLKFTDVYSNVELFLNDYQKNGIPTTIKDTTCMTLYYLLYASYGNSTIASSDLNTFKYRLFATVFKFGPTWEKRLDIQSTLRNLTQDEILKGSKQLYNHANNPSTPIVNNPDTYDGTLANKELTYVDDQNVTHNTRGILEGYTSLLELLETDVTSEFIDKFRKLFLTIVEPELPLWYSEEEEDNDE